VPGPNFWTFDLAAVKRVGIAGFGTTATYDPRQVQLGVKVLW